MLSSACPVAARLLSTSFRLFRRRFIVPSLYLFFSLLSPSEALPRRPVGFLLAALSVASLFPFKLRDIIVQFYKGRMVEAQKTKGKKANASAKI
jgi:hypothetical protein